MIELSRILTRIDEVVHKNQAYSGLLAIYREVVIASYQHCPDPISLILPADFAFEKIQAPAHCLERTRFVLDYPSAMLLFRRVLGLLKNKDNGPAVQNIFNFLAKNGDSTMEGFFSDGLLGHERSMLERAEKLGLDPSLINAAVHICLCPTAWAYSDRLKSECQLAEAPQRGRCPVCGSKPSISLLLGDAGDRYLHCSFCSHQWQSQRLYCPFCENTNHETLHLFFAEAQQEYRVDICALCQCYLKTVDTRKAPFEAVAPVEDLATLHLDILAQKRGLLRETLNPLGMRRIRATKLN